MSDSIFDCSNNDISGCDVSGCDASHCEIETPCIDLAVIKNENIHVTKKTTDCQIYLEPIDIPWRDFHMLFFYNNGVFTPNACLVRNAPSYLLYISNSCQTLQPGVTNGCCGELSCPQKFNLFSILKREFSEIADNCWSTCTKIQYNKKISKIKTLFDMNLCHVECSLTLDELFDTMQDQGITIDAESGLPVCPTNPDNCDIIINITTQFTAVSSETPPTCKTVEIIWQYRVNFDPTLLPPNGHGPCSNWLCGDRYKLSYELSENNSICCMNPDGNWHDIAPMPEDRSQFGMVQINNKIYVIGGTTGGEIPNILDSVLIYDTLNNIWCTGISIPIPLKNMGCVSDYCGKIYLISGETYSIDSSNNIVYNLSSNCYVYDTVKCPPEWKQIESIIKPRSYFGCVHYKNYIYALGGTCEFEEDGTDNNNGSNYYRRSTNTIEKYNIVTNSWSTQQNIPLEYPEGDVGLYNFACATKNNNIYIIGGLISSTCNFGEVIYPPLKEVIKFYINCEGNIEYDSRNTITLYFAGHRAITLNNIIYISGGWKTDNDSSVPQDFFEISNSVFEYNVESSALIDINKDTLEPRANFGFININNCVYSIGGDNNNWNGFSNTIREGEVINITE